MMLLVLLLGIIVGIAIGLTYATWIDAGYKPSMSHHYRGGYTDGHRDGAVGIWRGGPIK